MFSISIMMWECKLNKNKKQTFITSNCSKDMEKMAIFMIGNLIFIAFLNYNEMVSIGDFKCVYLLPQ